MPQRVNRQIESNQEENFDFQFAQNNYGDVDSSFYFDKPFNVKPDYNHFGSAE
jgi:hypothetical protein